MVSLTGPMSAIFQKTFISSAPPPAMWILINTGNSEVSGQSQLAFGAGVFVSPYSGGFIHTSPDAITWSLISTGLAIGLTTGVVFGGGQFVLTKGSIGGVQIATSPDGIVWTARTSAFSAVVGAAYVVAFSGSLYVIGGFNGSSSFNIQTSPTGVTWTIRDSSLSPLGATITGLAFGAGIFVAINNFNEIATSLDGITWTPQSSPFTITGTENFSVFHDGSGLFVACHAQGEIATSPDGITWTLSLIPIAAAFQSVGFGNGRWLVGGGLTVLTSPDGIVWTDNSPFPSITFNEIQAVLHANGTYVVRGQDFTLLEEAFAITTLIP